MDTTNSSEKPQRRVKHGQRPTEPLADWPAEFGAAGAEQPAATSGDVPADLQQLKALALAATPGPWERGAKGNGHELHVYGEELGGAAICGMDKPYNFTPHERRIQNLDYIAAANPAVVLGLIARIERATANAQPVSTSSERVENAAGNEQVERAAAPSPSESNMQKVHSAPATASGDELPPLSDAEYQSILGPVLSREGMRRYRNADPLNLDPSDLRAMIDRARAAVSAATKPTTEQIADVIERLIGACIMDWHSSDPDDAFNSDNEERRTLVDAVDKALAAKRAATKPTADLEVHNRIAQRLAWLENGTGINVPEFVADVQSLLATKPADNTERDALAAAIASAAEKRGIIAPGTSLTGPQLVMLCSDLATKPAAAVPAVSEELRKALQTVARWELPPTGKTWDDGSPMSYAACYGSNGERDYMRQVALNALAATPAASTIGAAQTADQVRDQALEDAARYCESAELLFDVDELMQRTKKELTAITANMLAEGVRALKRPATTENSEAGDA